MSLRPQKITQEVIDSGIVILKVDPPLYTFTIHRKLLCDLSIDMATKLKNHPFQPTIEVSFPAPDATIVAAFVQWAYTREFTIPFKLAERAQSENPGWDEWRAAWELGDLYKIPGLQLWAVQKMIGWMGGYYKVPKHWAAVFQRAGLETPSLHSGGSEITSFVWSMLQMEKTSSQRSPDAVEKIKDEGT